MREMKAIAVFVLLTAALPAIAVAQQRSPITVSIMTPTPVTKSGTDVRVNITVTNTSGHAVKLYKALGPDGQAEAANQVDVYDGEGKKLPRVDGRTMHVRGETYHLPKQWISRKKILVETGQSSDDFLVLSNLFDISKPGEYAVSVRQEMRTDDSDPDVKLIYATSNRITVTVLPADDPTTAQQ